MIFRSPYPEVEIPDLPLTPFVLEQAASLGPKPALIDGPSGRSLSYRRLLRGIRRIATGLSSRGFRKSDVFAIYSPNLPEFAVAFHAVLSVGGIVTPVDPRYTVEEVTRQLRLSGARYLLTIPQLIDRARAAAAAAGVKELFVLGRARGATPFARLLWSVGGARSVEIDPREDVAVLPFTSGTTGVPKGVMLTHRNLVANICQVRGTERSDQQGESDTVLGLLPFSHIFGLGVMNYALYRGATLVTVPRFEFREFLEILERYRVTYANLVPPLVRALALAPTVEDYDLGALAVIGSGAAALDAGVARACARRLDCLVQQGYGMTELSPVSHVNNELPDRVDPASIGRCVPNTETQIVDSTSGEALPPGSRGEILVRGPQVMKGYFREPDATAGAIDPAGWLHTGDLGVADADGYFTIVGRVKDLIKTQGYSVAPAELEAVLLRHPRIADAAVVGVPDEEAGEIPKAFVVRSGDLTSEEVAIYVRDRVAPFKRLREVEFVESVPRLLTGKIDRKELRARSRTS